MSDLIGIVDTAITNIATETTDKWLEDCRRLCITLQAAISDGAHGEAGAPNIEGAFDAWAENQRNKIIDIEKKGCYGIIEDNVKALLMI